MATGITILLSLLWLYLPITSAVNRKTPEVLLSAVYGNDIIWVNYNGLKCIKLCLSSEYAKWDGGIDCKKKKIIIKTVSSSYSVIS